MVVLGLEEELAGIKKSGLKVGEPEPAKWQADFRLGTLHRSGSLFWLWGEPLA
ncbi:hypothetical protein GCM10023213_26950 [Prosthecobacter algae]|uniref:Uncharacterized protein n=1 Tax=Prosthecobacter algae TaxID=1144682 RepID=A0ABP9P776_9BACT